MIKVTMVEPFRLFRESLKRIISPSITLQFIEDFTYLNNIMGEIDSSQADIILMEVDLSTPYIVSLHKFTFQAFRKSP